MLEILIVGIMLGWGAAIPIGPINLEMVRRNLQFGTRFGLAFGLGASSSDMIYLVLLSYGALTFLTYPLILKIIGFLGAIILVYFAYSAFTAKSSPNNKMTLGKASFFKQYVSGIILTLSNPMTILFWASISSQVVTLSLKHPQAIIFAGIGVILGTVSWVISLNIFIHFTKHKISDRVINILNKIGGFILLAFAAFSIYYSIFSI